MNLRSMARRAAPATPAEIIAACRGKRPVAMWLACRLLPGIKPGQLESEFHAEIEVIDLERARLDLAHARGQIAAPDEVWREIVGRMG